MRSAQAILRNREEAEDVVQQTILAVWERARNHEIRNPAGYLARAVYWNSIKRRSRKRVMLPLEYAPESSTQPRLQDDRVDPIELESAIADLPITQQTVIRLRFYLGLTFQEIGKNLSISTNTAASRTRYALVNLRKKLISPPKTSHKEVHHE